MSRIPHLLCATTISLLASTASATPKLVHHADAVPGEYIVVLANAPAATADDRAKAAEASDRLASLHGAAIQHRYASALRGFSARLTSEQAEALAQDPAVAYVEENGRVHADAVQTMPAWGLDRIDQPSLPLDQRYLQLGDGAGVTVYVIDTGLRTSHTEFAGRIPDTLYATTFTNAEDCAGHGTHVAGTIAGKTWGVAKAAKVIPVRVLDCNGSGTEADVILGIDYVAQHHAPLAVANLSLGGGQSVAEDQAVRNLVASGVTTVISAGNANADACNVTPARVPEAITVGAIGNDDRRASFSNWGACVDIFAPGVMIASAGIANDTAVNVLDGTSMAAPHVAGVAAAFLGANPTATPAMVTAAIIEGATRDAVGDPMGSPNRLLNARMVDRTPPTLTITSPAAGDHVQANFRVLVDASDQNLVAVALKVDAKVIATRESGPFGFDVTALEPGSHTLTVTSADAAGLTGEQTINVMVDGEVDTGTGPEELGGCSAGGSAALPFGLLLVGALALRRRRVRSALAMAGCSALFVACMVGEDTEPTVTTTAWVQPPCANPIVDANHDGVPDGLDLDCDGTVDIDLTGGTGTGTGSGSGGGGGSGSGGSGGSSSVTQCNASINDYSISCTRIDNNPAQCKCKIDDQLVSTCTTTSTNACSFPGPDNCCGF
ncbi:MAG TPA: S8 family serine peptidase [Kofleriaceae bacterium]|nr:S8 family serine peptidase [Kofleriaceae bacterium]